jgi:hypothetical protein
MGDIVASRRSFDENKGKRRPVCRGNLILAAEGKIACCWISFMMIIFVWIVQPKDLAVAVDA